LSSGVVQFWHELPHEQVHDSFGVFVAEQLVGRAQLERDWDVLLADPTRSDHNRLRHTRSLVPRRTDDNLRQQLAAFARPWAGALSHRWTKLSALASEAVGGPHLTSLAPHIDALFQ
jgi:hypothetical protein